MVSILIIALMELLLSLTAAPGIFADDPSPAVIFNAAGPPPKRLFEGLTLEERALARQKEAMFQRWLQTTGGIQRGEGEIGILTIYYKALNVPTREQERYYWCGPAVGQEILLYLGRWYSQNYLAGPWNPAAGQYGMETTEQEGTYVWKLARTLNALDNGAVPSWWVWEYANANGDQDFIVNKLVWDLGYNLPQVNRVLTNPPGPVRLRGFVGNYGHYIVSHGYWYYPPYVDKILYTNSYEDPYNGSETSLGRYWWPTDWVTYCTTVYNGGWIIW
jgi:hypothetical protein